MLRERGDIGLGYHDELVATELRAYFADGRISRVPDGSSIVDRISVTFPFAGSKIDWPALEDSRGAYEPSDKQAERFAAFFAENIARFGLAGSVLYVGDNRTEMVLKADLGIFAQVLDVLFSVPQHHYFVPPGCEWCMCFTMEGAMDFGRRQPNRTAGEASN